MNRNRKVILNLSICSIIFLITMVSFIYLKYIDISVIKAIYLPIYLIISVTILFKQFVFGYIFTSSVVVGLIIEYLIHQNQTTPNMKGAFSNTTILFIGAIVGVVTQLLLRRRKKDRIY